MKKKTAVINFVLIIIFALLSAFLTFFSFRIPFTKYDWNSFARGMNFGGDISDGVSARYSVSYSGDDGNAKTNLRKSIYQLLDDYYTQPSVYLEGDNVLCVDIGSEKNYADDERVENALSLIGTETSFSVYSLLLGTDNAISIGHVKTAYFQQIAGNNALVIQLNKEGTERLKEISSAGFMYIKINASDSPISNTSSDEITDGKIYVTGGNKASIVATLINLQCEKTGVSLTYSDTKNLTASIGNNVSLIFVIALIGLCLAALILFVILFRGLGLFSVFPLALFVGIYTLMLNILPNMQVNAGGLIATAFSLIIYLTLNFAFLSEIKKQFKDGKSVVNCTKFTFSKLLKNVVDFSMLLIIPLIVLIFVGSSALNNFALCLVVGLLTSMFVGLVVLKAMILSLIKLLNKHTGFVGLNEKKEAENE